MEEPFDFEKCIPMCEEHLSEYRTRRAAIMLRPESELDALQDEMVMESALCGACSRLNDAAERLAVKERLEGGDFTHHLVLCKAHEDAFYGATEAIPRVDGWTDDAVGAWMKISGEFARLAAAQCDRCLNVLAARSGRTAMELLAGIRKEADLLQEERYPTSGSKDDN
jgi:hypothetical protein